jgi:hypothetical protein
MKRWLPFCLLLALAACHKHAPSLDALAAAGQIQPHAPLQADLSITIKAPPAKIWGLLTQVQDWPHWNPAIVSAAGYPLTQLGNKFSWTTGGMTINATIQRAIPNQSLAWSGHVLNFHAIHVWDLSPQADGTTIVTMHESISGFLIAWFYARHDLEQSDLIWLSDLKAAAEK